MPFLNRELARLRGYRSMLFVPLMSKGAAIGMISVTRKEPGDFAAHHVQLLQTFADRAVIAIENVRLFDEVQAKTRDLEEALQQQTATANVLKVDQPFGVRFGRGPEDPEREFRAVGSAARRRRMSFCATAKFLRASRRVRVSPNCRENMCWRHPSRMGMGTAPAAY